MTVPSIKTSSEIKIMAEGGRYLADICRQLEVLAKPGETLLKLEKTAQALIVKTGGEAAFARVPGYHWATCLNVNESFVHGIPGAYVLQSGDVLSIDIGLYYHGFNTDTSVTFQVGTCASADDNKKNQHFLAAGRMALEKAIGIIKPGIFVGEISRTIQSWVEQSGYNVSRNLTGHGIGRLLHEPPKIPCFVYQPTTQTEIITNGMTLAIEVLYLSGHWETETDNDGWTIRSKDGKINAVFEKTIAVTHDGSVILT